MTDNMRTFNTITVSGIAGRDAEAIGNAKKFTLAVKDNQKSKDGNWTENTLWFDVIGTEIPDIHKGDKVIVEGRLSSREYNGKTYLQIKFPNVAKLEREARPQAPAQNDNYNADMPF